MNEPFDDTKSLSRRTLLRACALPVAGLLLDGLLSACSETAGAAPTGTAKDSGAGATPEAGSDAAVPWASGGTKAMKGTYPDPFGDGAGAACTLTSAMILGPCYADTLERKDISEGMVGVPMRLSLMVVRADGCAPVPGATVDIWHTCAGGYYSEFATGTACNPGTQDSTNVRFFRGVQTTDEHGRVDFDTIIPGWYAGRAVHVHFTVRENGKEYVTSQLFFDDALLDEIEQQLDYKARGPRDTRNTQDLVLPANDMSPYLLETAKQADGALHAWKVIALRTSLDEQLPQAGGGLNLPTFGEGGLPPGFPGRGAPPNGFPDGAPPNGVPRADGGGA